MRSGQPYSRIMRPIQRKLGRLANIRHHTVGPVPGEPRPLLNAVAQERIHQPSDRDDHDDQRCREGIEHCDLQPGPGVGWQEVLQEMRGGAGDGTQTVVDPANEVQPGDPRRRPCRTTPSGRRPLPLPPRAMRRETQSPRVARNTRTGATTRCRAPARRWHCWVATS